MIHRTHATEVPIAPVEGQGDPNASAGRKGQRQLMEYSQAGASYSSSDNSYTPVAILREDLKKQEHGVVRGKAELPSNTDHEKIGGASDSRGGTTGAGERYTPLTSPIFSKFRRSAQRARIKQLDERPRALCTSNVDTGDPRIPPWIPAPMNDRLIDALFSSSARLREIRGEMDKLFAGKVDLPSSEDECDNDLVNDVN